VPHTDVAPAETSERAGLSTASPQPSTHIGEAIGFAAAVAGSAAVEPPPTKNAPVLERGRSDPIG
jgi:hypothetical protein